MDLNQLGTIEKVVFINNKPSLELLITNDQDLPDYLLGVMDSIQASKQDLVCLCWSYYPGRWSENGEEPAHLRLDAEYLNNTDPGNKENFLPVNQVIDHFRHIIYIIRRIKNICA